MSESSETFDVEGISPSGLRFCQKVNLLPMAKLVGKSLIENGYIAVWVIMPDGTRLEQDELRQL